MNNFDTSENKGLLWNLLYEAKVFDNIPNNRVDLIKKILDDKIHKIKSSSGQDADNISLTELNKTVIMEMIEDIELYKVSTSEPDLITSQELSLNRQAMMETRLQSIQNDFNNLINVEKPKDIDFSDKVREPMGDIDKIFAEKMDSREKDLGNVVYVKQQWDTNIKIGEETELDNITKLSTNNFDNKRSQKKVKFLDDTPETIYKSSSASPTSDISKKMLEQSREEITGFMSRLKTSNEPKGNTESTENAEPTKNIQDNQDNQYNQYNYIMEKLETIQDIQTKILYHLENKS